MNTFIIVVVVGILSLSLAIIPLSIHAYNSTYDSNTDMVIKQGLEKCYSSFQNDNECLIVVDTLDKKCQIQYFHSYFDNLWNPYMKHLEEMIQEGKYPDERYKEDPYLTLNNHHFGNSKIK